MTIQEVTDQDYFHYILDKASKTSQLVVVDVVVSGSPQCKMMTPMLEKFSKTYTNAIFLKVDIETCPDFKEFSKVATTQVATDALPTFFLYQNKTKVDEVLGAHHLELEKLIMKHGGSLEEEAEE
ncbi:MAG: thioredoxin-like protein [Linnemannia elongata]|nr:MAG: thioredoxin-like protein [Linnemannia elongata]